MNNDTLKMLEEFNRYFISGNDVDVPARISVSRDEWRQLYKSLKEQNTQSAEVTDDVARDADRYRWLRDPKNHAQIGIGQWTDDGFGWRYGTEADEIIDAAILAAAQAQKGK